MGDPDGTPIRPLKQLFTSSSRTPSWRPSHAEAAHVEAAQVGKKEVCKLNVGSIPCRILTVHGFECWCFPVPLSLHFFSL